MRSCKRIKFNMIIAILLCMAFVVNIGTTLAVATYSFKASSINKITNDGGAVVHYDTYTNFALAETSSGNYVYKQGTTNNQLSISYGFNSNYDESLNATYNYDLMVKFTATYVDKGASNTTTHLANDFTINFVNRDDWCIDMGTHQGLVAGDANKKYYTTGSDSATLNGVMYYMGTKTGSGTLPIISSVTFHTSPNNSYTYIGDELKIELTPYYVRSKTANYGVYGASNQHQFYSIANTGRVADIDAFNNWISYMARTNQESAVADSYSVMIYNSYVDDARSLAFPMDSAVMEKNQDGTYKGDVDKATQKQPYYVNTAYRYTVDEIKDGATTTYKYNYDAITAGNKYNGGLGVYVIPDANLITISINFSHYWQKNNVLAGPSDSEWVKLQTSNQIKTITLDDTPKHCYNADIDKPTYINVLDYIQFTAEDYKTIISGEYSLILDNISVGVEKSNDYDEESGKYLKPSRLSALPCNYVKNSYEIHNSTATSPVLVKSQDVAGGESTYETNISITNNSSSILPVKAVIISSKLWYEDYTNKTASEKLVTDNNYLIGTAFTYDTKLWEISGGTNGIFKLTRKNGVTYIPSGYSLTVITGVVVQGMTPDALIADNNAANDFWCSLDVESVEFDASVSYNESSTTGVETIVDGYYRAITEDDPGKIYIRNNTNQIITGVADFSLSTLTVSPLSGNTDYLPRQQVVAGVVNYTATKSSYLEGEISLKPGEKVLAYTIKPETGKTAIIYSYSLSVTLENKSEASDIDLIYTADENATGQQDKSIGVIINNSKNYYEFRLVSPVEIDNKFISTAMANKFVKIETTSLDDQDKEVTTYTYYYVGVLMPNRSMQIFKEFASNVSVEYLIHDQTAGQTHYQESNYNETAWELTDAVHGAWFTAMKNLYKVTA